MNANRQLFRAGALVVALSSPPALGLPDHYTYDVVLGQPNKGVRKVNAPNDLSLGFPTHAVVDPVRKHLYISELNNARILAWADVEKYRSGAPPDLIIGQANKNAAERYRKDQRSISNPTGMAVDKDGTLWVTDQGHGRVVGFLWPFDPQQPLEERLSADRLIGQTAYNIGYRDKACNLGSLFGSPGAGPASDSVLCEPADISADVEGNLYVADRRNSRVLRFKAPIPEVGARADKVYGQDSMNSPATSICNKVRNAPADATTLCRPQGVFVHQDGAVKRLYVADTDSHRVVVYDDPDRNSTANRVFGQPSMTRSTPGSGPDRLRSPTGVAVDRNGVVWIADGQHRVLGFAPPFPSSDAGATYLIGQTDANGDQPNRGTAGRPVPLPSAATLYSPRRVSFDTLSRMLVADTSNHRVLIFPTPTVPNAAASLVIGQPDFRHGAENSPKQTGLGFPVGVAIDRPDPMTRPGEPIHVYVADFNNSRVLGWWDLGALKDGQPADLLLGQRSFTDYACNMGRGVNDKSLCFPRGVAVDKDGDLWVADTFNHRVVRFARPFDSKDRYQSANLVLGQAGFLGSLHNATATTTPSARTLWHPSAVAVDRDGTVWVADRDNDRVVGYKRPYENGMAAARLLIGAGLSRFDQLGCSTRPTMKADQLCGPTGLAIDPSGNLFVAERDNNRVALYSTVPHDMMNPHLVNPVALAVIGQPSQAAISANQGLAAPSATTLRNPEGVAVEVDGMGVATAVLVADTGNHRVLIYDPVAAGFQPPAKKVIGQDDNFAGGAFNIEFSIHEIPSTVARALWSPAAVLATAEGLFISDSGATSTWSTRAGHVLPAPVDVGNSRVILIKGPNFPMASMKTWQPPAAGPDEEEPDLLIPDPPDLAMPEDLATPPPPPDLATPLPPPPSMNTGACSIGGSADANASMLALLLLALAMVRRRPG